MTRALLAAAVALAARRSPPPAGAAGTGVSVEDDERHICVVTNSEKREGYCVTTWGVVQLPDLPDLP